MTVSPPRPRPLEPALPPMPRRQSCDRCHEQKVRCVTEGLDGALILGGIAEQGDSKDGHVVSPVPCVRCRKAGAICIYSRNEVGLGIQEHPQESAYQHAAPQTTPLASPAATTPHYEQGTHHNLGLDTPPFTDHWQTPSYGSDGSQSLTDMCQVTSFSAAPTGPCVPLFPGPATNVVPTTAEHVMGNYSWCFPTSDYFLEELAQINLRIHLAGRALLLPARAPAPSPAVNDVFDAASSLINLVDSFASRRSLPPTNLPDTDRGAVNTALDSSTCLMIHACHQALLGAFEDLSSSLLHLSKPQRHTPPQTPDASFLPPCTTQAVAMTNLISHLLNQLDRAVLSLPGNFNLPPPRHHEHGTIPTSAAIFGHGQCEPPDLHPGHDTWRGNAALSLFSEMEERQMRVRGQVKAVERLLRQAHVP
ncbi:hypothetical protein C8A01DRAFT_18666 [Parachaetomium inaequale]|uniref:Zn(2)-C6 fungal-type domain-containing protein n=1 Tax=Parachaetomium inaequale TaxID=2588326 RepID=A0AAN6PBY7_9PEZI|nr:hypothetical protein C8A01DRAFT_18666 [Parachaetomium inaequale]